MARKGSGVAMAVLAVGVMLAGGPAAAFDIRGTWTGSVNCKGIFNGAPQSVTSSSTLLIDNNGELELAIDAFHYSGLAIFDPAKPDKGNLAIIRCDTNATRSSGEFGGELGRLKVSTRPAKGTGSISGTSYRFSVLLADSLFTCRWSFKRTSTDHPTLAGCSTPAPT